MRKLEKRFAKVECFAILMLLPCLVPLVPPSRQAAGQSAPREGRGKDGQPFSHNRCNWLPGSLFSDTGYSNATLGLEFYVPEGWRVDSKFLSSVNWTTPPPPRPSNSSDAATYDDATKVKGCTIVAITRTLRQNGGVLYPRVEIDLGFDPEAKDEVAAKSILQTAIRLYKENPKLRALSGTTPLRFGGFSYLKVDSELLDSTGNAHWFHRSMVSIPINHLIVTIRITATSSLDLEDSTLTLDALHINETKFKLELNPPQAKTDGL